MPPDHVHSQTRPTSTVAPETSQSPQHPSISLVEPSQKKRSRPVKLLHAFRSVFRSFPIFTPTCKLPAVFPSGPNDGAIHGGTRMTGTLYGTRKARVTLAIQDTPRSIPTLVLELAIPTSTLQREMASGLVRIALECEKRAADKTKLVEEHVWNMYCNGRKTGYATKRDPSEGDLGIMQVLKAVSMGAGVIPNEAEGQEGELTYMRAYFERVVGSKDSEAFYMLNPDGNNGPELSLFFVRI